MLQQVVPCHALLYHGIPTMLIHVCFLQWPWVILLTSLSLSKQIFSDINWMQFVYIHDVW